MFNPAALTEYDLIQRLTLLREIDRINLMITNRIDFICSIYEKVFNIENLMWSFNGHSSNSEGSFEDNPNDDIYPRVTIVDLNDSYKDQEIND